MSFVGSYYHSLDAKKRVFIPSKYREELGEVFYITRKFDTYLSIYTADEWDTYVEKIEKLPESVDEWDTYVEKIEKLPESVAAEIQDFIIGGAQKCTLDGSGRIIIEDRLLKHAKIDKNVVFVGVGRQIRIWSEELWEKHDSNRNFEQMRDVLREFGL